MEPVDGGNPLLAKEAGDALVGGQHAFLDQPVTLPAFPLNHARGLTPLVELDAILGQVEVDGTPIEPHRGEPGRQGVGPLEERLQMISPRHALAAEHAVHLGVGAPRVAPHDRRVQLRAQGDALSIDDQISHHAQPVDVRLERADAVGEPLGQHRQHPPRKVDAGRPPERLGVERRVLGHVVRDVGDGHDEPKAAGVIIDEDGVVEVAGVLPVDGDERQLAQISAMLSLRLPVADVEGHAIGLVHHLDGELVMEPPREGDRQHLDRMIIDRAQRARHLAGEPSIGEQGVSDAKPHLDGVTRSRKLGGRHADAA